MLGVRWPLPRGRVSRWGGGRGEAAASSWRFWLSASDLRCGLACWRPLFPCFDLFAPAGDCGGACWCLAGGGSEAPAPVVFGCCVASVAGQARPRRVVLQVAF